MIYLIQSELFLLWKIDTEIMRTYKSILWFHIDLYIHRSERLKPQLGVHNQKIILIKIRRIFSFLIKRLLIFDNDPWNELNLDHSGISILGLGNMVQLCSPDLLQRPRNAWSKIQCRSCISYSMRLIQHAAYYYLRRLGPSQSPGYRDISGHDVQHTQSKWSIIYG